MDRPYIICHILSALNGKISGPFMGTPEARLLGGEYAKLRDGFHADAWLYGAVTTKEFTQGKRPEPVGPPADVPEGDFIAEKEAELYYVSVDTDGEIGWESGTFHKEGRPDAHVIEVLTEQTPAAYRGYLRKRGVSYILAGKSGLDCQVAAEKLYRLFGIETLLICGGGTVNWSFLQQGALDELSLLVAPAADGISHTPSVFEKSEILPPSAPAEFQLKKVERISNNGLWLTYLVSKTEETKKG